MFPVPTIDNVAVLVILIGMFFLLYREYFNSALTFFFGILLFYFLGYLEAEEIISGFANPLVAVIAMLLIMSVVIRKTGYLDYLFERLFARTTTYRGFLFRLMLLSSVSSAFLNNTPIVSTLVPYVQDWGRKYGITPSKLLIPLSYASILGGTATLIGTSTNLVVSGLAVEAGMDPFGLFDFSLVGVPLIILGIIYLLFVSSRLLPEKEDIIDIFKSNKREYFLETYVKKDSHLVGKTIYQSGLHRFEGAYLVEIIRGEKSITEISKNEVIGAGDTLIFLGIPDVVVDIIKHNKGLTLPKQYMKVHDEDIRLVEAVVPFNSPLVGEQIKRIDFRRTYGANVLAVHRNGEEVSGKIGRILLRPGDLLLLAYSKYKQITVGQDLYLFARVKKPKLMGHWRAGSTIAGAIAAILVAAFTPVSLFVSLLVFIAFLLMSGTATMRDVRRGIETQIIFIAAFAFVLGKVMLATDTARYVSDVIIHMTDGFGLIGFLFGIYLATNLITEFVTNIAAASLMFPVAFTSAGTLAVDPVPLVLTVAFAASASFISPIGYQTNLIVYGTGDYSFKDFFRIGLPLSLLYMVVTVFILAVSYGFLSF